MAVPSRPFALILIGLALMSLAAWPASSQPPARGHGAEAHDMELVGHDDLQGRSAYQPSIHQQRGHFIAYVGHHGGRARNPLTGADEDNGTSIVDVTDPAQPRYLAHIPGPPGGSEQGGAQLAHLCDRSGQTYLLRTFANAVPNSALATREPRKLCPSGWRSWRMTKICDRSDPARPVFNRDFGLAGQGPGSTGPL